MEGDVAVSDKITLAKHNSSHIIEFVKRKQSLEGIVRRRERSGTVSAADSTYHSLKPEIESESHTLEVTDLLLNLNTNSFVGLDDVAAMNLLNRNGKNVLSAPLQKPMWLKFIGSFFSGFGPLLWVASLFVFLAWQPFGTPPTNVYNLALAIMLLIVTLSLFLFFFRPFITQC